MVDDIGPMFEALADPTRRRVVQLLSQGPRRAGEISDSAGVSGPRMSRHLRVLLEAGVVTDERPPGDARVRVFRLRPDSIVAVQAWLDQLQAHWGEQLQSFKRGKARREPMMGTTAGPSPRLDPAGVEFVVS